MGHQVIQMNENTWRIENEIVRFFLLTGKKRRFCWIKKLIGAAEDILSGNAAEVPGNMFGNPITVCPFEFATFLMDGK